MIKGIYVGCIEELKNKSALLRRNDEGFIAQFDSLTLYPWCYGWHQFTKADFVNVIDHANPNDPNAQLP